jgi:DNA-binding MarR family transcriptional regulator
MVYSGHTGAGAQITQLILASFPFHGALMEAGERLTQPAGLTSARWQILSVLARADRPETVANLARIMGLTRQAVQRVANDLAAGGFVEFGPNPHHKRALLVSLTDKGLKAFQSVTSRQVPWANALAAEFDIAELDVAATVLCKLQKLLEAHVGEH